MAVFLVFSSCGGCGAGCSEPLSQTPAALHGGVALQPGGAGMGRAADGSVPSAGGGLHEHRAAGAGGDPPAAASASRRAPPQGQTRSSSGLEKKEEVGVQRREVRGPRDVSPALGALLEGGALPYAHQRQS